VDEGAQKWKVPVKNSHHRARHRFQARLHQKLLLRRQRCRHPQARVGVQETTGCLPPHGFLPAAKSKPCILSSRATLLLHQSGSKIVQLGMILTSDICFKTTRRISSRRGKRVNNVEFYRHSPLEGVGRWRYCRPGSRLMSWKGCRLWIRIIQR
jgi:hypothetical protein